MAKLKTVLHVELVAQSYQTPKFRIEKGWKADVDADDPLAPMYKSDPAFKVTEKQVSVPETAVEKPAAPDGGKGEGTDTGGEGEGGDTEVTEETPLSEVKLGVTPEGLVSLAEAGFETVGSLREAKAEDLVQLTGIGQKTADKLVALGASLDDGEE